MDLSIFLTPEAWISLVTLLFLEIILGVDNIVFITITSNRLPENKQHLGRKLGLAGAMVSRVCFLCVASFLASLKDPLFVLDLMSFTHAVSIHDLIMLFGGIYLIYKGISELRYTLSLGEIKAEQEAEETGVDERHNLSVPKAVATIMVMDIVFSIDSVITAVGLANYLIVMVLAVIIAILLMMVFIDAVSDFINKHTEMTILALTFITVIGILLVLEGLTVNSGIEILDMHAEKLMVYFAMIFSVVIAFMQIRYKSNLDKYMKSKDAGAEEIVEDPLESE